MTGPSVSHNGRRFVFVRGMATIAVCTGYKRLGATARIERIFEDSSLPASRAQRLRTRRQMAERRIPFLLVLTAFAPLCSDSNPGVGPRGESSFMPTRTPKSG